MSLMDNNPAFERIRKEMDAKPNDTNRPTQCCCGHDKHNGVCHVPVPPKHDGATGYFCPCEGEP